ncbi:MAG: hypothetical protein ACM3TR_06755 [Caulobacteraceae bacterium]
MSNEQQSPQNKYDNNEDDSLALETSLLFEPQVIKVILVLLPIALWYRFIPLIVVSAFLVLLFGVITIWKKLSLVNVKPSLQLSKSRLFTGEEFQVNASLYNNKWLPLIWIEWSYPKNNVISLGDIEGEAYTVRFLWLLWFQKINWTLTGKALRRGVYNIGQVKLRSGDGFRFAEIEKLYDMEGKVYVYPKLVSVNVPVFRPSMQWGVKGKQSQCERRKASN